MLSKLYLLVYFIREENLSTIEFTSVTYYICFFLVIESMSFIILQNMNSLLLREDIILDLSQSDQPKTIF